MMLFSLLALTASAQKVEAEQAVVDCGQVLFRQPVTTEFQLKNTGNKPLLIKNVRRSCGCTEVDYPRQEIAPGQTFRVKTVYDAKQMGTFQKQVALFTNASAGEPLVLTLQGRVVEKKMDFDGQYAYTLGKLKADADDIEFDDVNLGDRPTQRIHIFNATDQVMQPQVMHVPSYLSVTVSPSRLAPRHSGEIAVTLDSRKLRDLGLNQTSVYLGANPGDKVAQDKEVTVSAVLLPSFAEMTPQQMASAPKVSLSTTQLNLGSFNGKRKLKGEILITNKGAQELDIRSMQMFSGGLQVSLSDTKIKPGETARLKVTALASEMKKSRSRKPRILMITNDPSMPKVTVTVEATL